MRGNKMKTEYAKNINKQNIKIQRAKYNFKQNHSYRVLIVIAGFVIAACVLGGIGKALANTGFNPILNILAKTAPTPSSTLTGLGTEGNPLTINSEADLRYFRNLVATSSASDSNPLSTLSRSNGGSATDDVDVYIKLTTDITMSESMNPIGFTANSSGDIINPFRSHFDGGGHIIKNLSLPFGNGRSYGALFSKTNGAEIKNLGLENVTISGKNNSGTLIGSMTGGSVSHCWATGNITGNNSVGGLIGGASNATITNNYARVFVNAAGTSVGGFIGFVANTTSISNSYSAGETVQTSYNAANSHTGSFIGSGGNVTNVVGVSPKISAKYALGKLSGDSSTLATNSYYWDNMGFTNTGAPVSLGSSATATELLAANWWKNTVNFDNSIWYLQDGWLPVLKGFGLTTTNDGVDGFINQNNDGNTIGSQSGNAGYLQPVTNPVISVLSYQNETLQNTSNSFASEQKYAVSTGSTAGSNPLTVCDTKYNLGNGTSVTLSGSTPTIVDLGVSLTSTSEKYYFMQCASDGQHANSEWSQSLQLSRAQNPQGSGDGYTSTQGVNDADYNTVQVNQGYEYKMLNTVIGNIDCDSQTNYTVVTDGAGYLISPTEQGTVCVRKSATNSTFHSFASAVGVVTKSGKLPQADLKLTATELNYQQFAVKISGGSGQGALHLTTGDSETCTFDANGDSGDTIDISANSDTIVYFPNGFYDSTCPLVASKDGDTSYNAKSLNYNLAMIGMASTDLNNYYSGDIVSASFGDIGSFDLDQKVKVLACVVTNTANGSPCANEPMDVTDLANQYPLTGVSGDDEGVFTTSWEIPNDWPVGKTILEVIQGGSNKVSETAPFTISKLPTHGNQPITDNEILGSGPLTLTYLDDEGYKISGLTAGVDINGNVANSSGIITNLSLEDDIAELVDITKPVVVDGANSSVERANSIKVILDGVKIDCGSNGGIPFDIQNGGNTEITLVNNNLLSTGTYQVGTLRVQQNNGVTIVGEGSLTVNGANGGAGIGGSVNESGGDITITDHVKVTVTSNVLAAGIGGGQYGAGGNITIAGNAQVAVSCNIDAACIGGGRDGAGGNVIIRDSALVATGGNSYCSDIGFGSDYKHYHFCGDNANSASVTISGGLVFGANNRIQKPMNDNGVSVYPLYLSNNLGTGKKVSDGGLPYNAMTFTTEQKQFFTDNIYNMIVDLNDLVGVMWVPAGDYSGIHVGEQTDWITHVTNSAPEYTDHPVSDDNWLTPLKWGSVSANGEANKTATDKITLNFNGSVPWFSEDDISLTGATKVSDSLAETSLGVYTLGIVPTVAEGENVTVNIDVPTESSLATSQKSVAIHIGKPHQEPLTITTISRATDDSSETIQVSGGSGAGQYTLGTATSSVCYTYNSQPSANSNMIIYRRNAGDCIITLDKAGDTDWAPADQVTQKIHFAPKLSYAQVTRTWQSKASVTFRSDTVGTYYWQLDGDVPATAQDVTQSTGGYHGSASMTNYNNTLSLNSSTLGVDLAGGEHKLYLVGVDASDAVSLQIFTVTIPADTTKPTLSKISAERTGENTASVNFTSDEPGTYYYVVVENGQPKPDEINLEDGVDFGEAALSPTFTLDSLDPAKEYAVYIIAKDTADNKSDTLQGFIPKFGGLEITDDKISSSGLLTFTYLDNSSYKISGLVAGSTIGNYQADNQGVITGLSIANDEVFCNALTKRIVIDGDDTDAERTTQIKIALANSKIVGSPAISVTNGGFPQLKFESDNSLNSNNDSYAGLQVQPGEGVSIIGSGKLTAVPGRNSAAIGGGINSDGGYIQIGGNITIVANSGEFGAGIGGGRCEQGVCQGSNILITDNAAVTAKSGKHGAGIGGGHCGNNGIITIEGNAKVVASGGQYGAGIGGGNRGSSKLINIGGNATVFAFADTGAAIGSGLDHDGRTTPITSGEINIGANAVVVVRSGTSGIGLGGIAGSNNDSVYSNLTPNGVVGKHVISSSLVFGVNNRILNPVDKDGNALYPLYVRADEKAEEVSGLPYQPVYMTTEQEQFFAENGNYWPKDKLSSVMWVKANDYEGVHLKNQIDWSANVKPTNTVYTDYVNNKKKRDNWLLPKEFIKLEANGSRYNILTSKLTMTFDEIIPWLTEDDVVLTGANIVQDSFAEITPGVYTVDIVPTVAEGENVNVHINKPEGSSLTPTDMSVVVHTAALAQEPLTLTKNSNVLKDNNGYYFNVQVGGGSGNGQYRLQASGCSIGNSYPSANTDVRVSISGSNTTCVLTLNKYANSPYAAAVQLQMSFKFSQHPTITPPSGNPTNGDGDPEVWEDQVIEIEVPAGTFNTDPVDDGHAEEVHVVLVPKDGQNSGDDLNITGQCQSSKTSEPGSAGNLPKEDGSYYCAWKVPGDVDLGDYDIVARQDGDGQNGNTETETLPGQPGGGIEVVPGPDTTKPVLSKAFGERVDDTHGTATFTSSEAGQYYYAVVESGAAALTPETSTDGVAFDGNNLTQIINIDNLDPSKDHDVYLIVKDTSGNVSDAIQAYIPKPGVINITDDDILTASLTITYIDDYTYKITGLVNGVAAGSKTADESGEITGLSLANDQVVLNKITKKVVVDGAENDTLPERANTVKVKLAGVNIKISGFIEKIAPFSIQNGGNVELSLVSSNKFDAGYVQDYAGLEVQLNSGVTIIGSGSLTSYGYLGAGIGGADGSAGSIIITDNAKVVARSYFGAGIGGAQNGSGGNIVISGNSQVIATNKYGGTGIGGGTSGAAGNIQICDSALVLAQSVSTFNSDDIGYDPDYSGGDSSKVTITGGFVFGVNNKIQNPVDAEGEPLYPLYLSEDLGAGKVVSEGELPYTATTLTDEQRDFFAENGNLWPAELGGVMWVKDGDYYNISVDGVADYKAHVTDTTPAYTAGPSDNWVVVDDRSAQAPLTLEKTPSVADESGVHFGVKVGGGSGDGAYTLTSLTPDVCTVDNEHPAAGAEVEVPLQEGAAAAKAAKVPLLRRGALEEDGVVKGQSKTTPSAKAATPPQEGNLAALSTKAATPTQGGNLTCSLQLTKSGDTLYKDADPITAEYKFTSHPTITPPSGNPTNGDGNPEVWEDQVIEIEVPAGTFNTDPVDDGHAEEVHVVLVPKDGQNGGEPIEITPECQSSKTSEPGSAGNLPKEDGSYYCAWKVPGGIDLGDYDIVARQDGDGQNGNTGTETLPGQPGGGIEVVPAPASDHDGDGIEDKNDVDDPACYLPTGACSDIDKDAESEEEGKVDGDGNVVIDPVNPPASNNGGKGWCINPANGIAAYPCQIKVVDKDNLDNHFTVVTDDQGILHTINLNNFDPDLTPGWHWILLEDPYGNIQEIKVHVPETNNPVFPECEAGYYLLDGVCVKDRDPGNDDDFCLKDQHQVGGECDENGVYSVKLNLKNITLTTTGDLFKSQDRREKYQLRDTVLTYSSYGAGKIPENKNVVWSSSNPKIAKVSNTGLVTALRVGTATITVKTVDGAKTDKCKVTVKLPKLFVYKNNFADTKKLTTEFKQYIKWMYDYAVTTGVTPKTYQPNNPVRRDQMAMFLHRLTGLPDFRNIKKDFKDMKPKMTGYVDVMWLMNEGITTGTDPKHYSPAAPVTRMQMALFMYRLAKSNGIDVTTGVTTKNTYHVKDWEKTWDKEYKLAVNWLLKSNVSTQRNTTYWPSQPVTRAQMAAFMNRLYNNSLIK
jgi:hypothetical protein